MSEQHTHTIIEDHVEVLGLGINFTQSIQEELHIDHLSKLPTKFFNLLNRLRNERTDTNRKETIRDALTLNLDFINMFLYF